MRFRAVLLCFLLIFAVSLSGCRDKDENNNSAGSKADDTSQSQIASQKPKTESKAQTASKSDKKAASTDAGPKKTSSKKVDSDESSRSSSSQSASSLKSESGQEKEHTHSEDPLTAEQLNPTDPLVVFEGGEQAPSEMPEDAKNHAFAIAVSGADGYAFGQVEGCDGDVLVLLYDSDEKGHYYDFCTYSEEGIKSLTSFDSEKMSVYTSDETGKLWAAFHTDEDYYMGPLRFEDEMVLLEWQYFGGFDSDGEDVMFVPGQRLMFKPVAEAYE